MNPSRLDREGPQNAVHGAAKKAMSSLPTSFHPRKWWSSCFRFALHLGGSFSRFLRSFHRKPATPPVGLGTAVMWPMPLPFPGVCRSSGAQSEKSSCDLQRGINFTIALLNWLHLNRPETCPSEIVLGSSLNKVQWRVVRQIQTTMAAWDEMESITMANMGRAATKIADIESLLGRLHTFAEGVFQEFDESFPDLSGSSRLHGSKQKFSPGLQVESAGNVVGCIPTALASTAKPIIADRLDFQSEPSFDPSPFLDEQCRFIFQDPMSAAKKPDESFQEPPAVRIFGSDKEVWNLLWKLDQSGRLGAVKEEAVYTGFQAGLFSVGKDQNKDRLIFDSRPFNELESPPGRFIGSMASAANLTEIHLKEDQILTMSGTDLREFYYSFLVSKSREARNSLLIQTTPERIQGWRCLSEDLVGYKGVVFLALRTLAMGDTCAVELAQTAHIGILHQLGMISEKNLISMTRAIPRSLFSLGVVIDDLIMFQIVAAGTNLACEETFGKQQMEAALERFESLGLIPHRGKTFFQDETAEFWGAMVEGRRGYVRASLRRVIPVLFATVGVLKLGVCSFGLLETLIGCWTSIFLFRRRLLSIFNVAYEALQRDARQNEVFKLSPGLVEELLLCVGLGPLAATYLRGKDQTQVYCSDASSRSYAVCAATLPVWLQSEVHRFRLRKTVWVKLLSPLKALNRLKGILPPAEELPAGVPLPSHPLWLELATVPQFKCIKKVLTKEGSHINVDELKGILVTERLAAHDSFPSRFFSLADSQVALGAVLKGRSSSLGLNTLLQGSLPVHLGCGMAGSYGFCPSESNCADDPTRNVPVRSPTKCPSSWWPNEVEFSEERRLEMFDDWLASYGTSEWDLSGLPSLDELSGVVDEDPGWKRTKKSKKFFTGCANKKAQRNRTVPLVSAAEFSEAYSSTRETDDSLSAREPTQGQSFSACSSFTPEVSRSQSATVPPASQFRQVPSAELLGLPRLSERAIAALKRVPRAQFIFPKDWKVSNDCRPDFAGYLDLYSGKRGVAKAVSSGKFCWSITFEIELGEQQNVLLEENQKLIAELIASKAVHTCGAAIACRSFSRAVRPPVRSRSCPEGFQQLSAVMQQKVDEGNVHALWLASIIRLCRTSEVRYWVENPDGSFLWWLACWRELGAHIPENSWRVDYCMAGAPWRKRTRIFTDLQVKGERVMCDRSHQHRRLVGWSRVHRKPWTRVAQEYPRRFCAWLSNAILHDAGLLPGRKRVSPSTMAKQTSARIGEAQNPGPRHRGPRQRRPLQTLLNVSLVEPGTELLGERTWESLRRWSLRSMDETCFDSLARCPQTLCLLIECFGQYLYKEGHSLYVLRQLITHVQRWKPSFKGHFAGAWQLVAKWEQVEPLRHRTPLPLVLYKAMLSIGLMWKWYRFSGIMVLAFRGLCRPGEPLAAKRSDLLLARDLVVEDPAVVYLKIQNPKGRRRGIGTVQHTKIVDADSAKFLDWVFHALPRDSSLFPGSAGSFRRRWDKILQFLQVPQSFQITPASLRSGGAIAEYRSNQDLSLIMWRMRIKHMGTLQHYIQEVGAASIFVELPQNSRERVQEAALLCDALFNQF